MKRLHDERDALRRLHDKLPLTIRNDLETKAPLAHHRDPRITIANLVYRQTRFEKSSKDYDFSRSAMTTHWDAGCDDATEKLNNLAWKTRRTVSKRVQIYDVALEEQNG